MRSDPPERTEASKHVHSGRYIQIGVVVCGYLIGSLLVWLGWWRPRATPPERFTRMLERPGTAAIKLGQAMKLHTEFLPADYVGAPFSLQDHVAAFHGGPGRARCQALVRPSGYRAVRCLRDHSLGRRVDRAGARRPPPHGREVVVKVRRPGIKGQVERDMKITALLIRAVLVVMRRWRLFDPPA